MFKTLFGFHWSENQKKQPPTPKLKLRNKRNNREVSASIEDTRDVEPGSLPVMIIEEVGRTGPIKFIECYEILEASDRELELLRLGGYPVKNDIRIIHKENIR